CSSPRRSLLDRVEEHERARLCSRRGSGPRPPVFERGGVSGTDGVKARRMEPNSVENLGGPEARDDVRHPQEPSSGPEALGHHGGQVAALRVVAAECVLEIREPSPVLDVELGASRDVPSQDVSATRELVMLERLVECDLESVARKSCSDGLTHRSMDGVLAANRYRSHARVYPVHT